MLSHAADGRFFEGSVAGAGSSMGPRGVRHKEGLGYGTRRGRFVYNGQQIVTIEVGGNPMRSICAVIVGLLAAEVSLGEEKKPELTPAERGRAALLTKAYVPAGLTRATYDNAWKEWGLKEKPAADQYDRLF